MRKISRAATAAALALAGVSSQAAVGGLITAAGTGQPPAPGSFVYAQLMMCSHAGNELCDQGVDFMEVKDGKYRFTGAYAPGRYQVNVTADGFVAAHPATFQITANETHRIDVALDALPIAFSAPSGCDAPDAQGFCHVSFHLQNTSATAQDLDAWVMVATTSAVPAGWSRFAAGDHAPGATRLQLPAGKARTVDMAVYVGRDMPNGAYSTMELYVSPHGEPDRTLVFDMLPTVYFGVDGAGLTPADAAARAKAHARRPSPLRTAAAPDGKSTTLVWKVTDAETGLPLPLSAKPLSTLMACNEPDDTYCRWIEGDSVPLTDTGIVVVDTAGMFPGRYSMTTSAADNYGYTYSATFEVPFTEGPKVIAQPMKRMPIAVDGVDTCTATPVDECVFTYHLRNTTDQPQDASLWLYDNLLAGEFSVGSSVFTQGRRGEPLAAPMHVTIAPGATALVKQPAGLGRLASGSSGWFQLYIGDRREPAYGEGFYRLGNYTVYEDKGPKMITVTPFPF